MNTVEGADRITKMFEQMPKEMRAETKKAMRSASRPWLARLRSAAPYSQWKSLAKTSVRTRKGIISCLIGFFGPDAVHWEWMKAYWYNYGTLQRRDPSHQFMHRIRNKSNRRNEVGQPARNWFDPVAAGAGDDIANKTITWIENYIDRL